MRRYGQRLVGWVALTAMWLTAAVASAQVEQSPDPDKATVEALRQIQLQLRMLQDSLEDFKKRIDPVSEEVAALRRQVEQLQLEVNRLKSVTTSKSLFQPTTGRIRLVNTFPGPRTILVNDRSYRLQAGETRVLEEPVGRFTYEVLGYHTEPQVRDLDAMREFVITVFPIVR